MWEMRVEQLAAARIEEIARSARTTAALAVSPEFLEKLPVAIYACDAEGRILWFNARAAKLWGREPRIGDEIETYCGSPRLYFDFDGRPTTRQQSPMGTVLSTGRAIRGVEAKLERPDGSSIWATVHIEPVEDADGRIVGAIGCFHETTSL